MATPVQGFLIWRCWIVRSVNDLLIPDLCSLFFHVQLIHKSWLVLVSTHASGNDKNGSPYKAGSVVHFTCHLCYLQCYRHRKNIPGQFWGRPAKYATTTG